MQLYAAASFCYTSGIPGMKAFSELWIDPKMKAAAGRSAMEKDHVHVLITFDIPGIGQMEAEFQVAGGRWILSVLSGIIRKLCLGGSPDFRKIMEEVWIPCGRKWKCSGWTMCVH